MPQPVDLVKSRNVKAASQSIGSISADFYGIKMVCAFTVTSTSMALFFSSNVP